MKLVFLVAEVEYKFVIRAKLTGKFFHAAEETHGSRELLLDKAIKRNWNGGG